MLSVQVRPGSPSFPLSYGCLRACKYSMSRMFSTPFAGYALPVDCQENTMKTPRKGPSEPAPEKARGSRRSESSQRGKTKKVPSDAGQRPKSKVPDLPPNENIRKRADEIYRDTEIPERKPGS